VAVNINEVVTKTRERPSLRAALATFIVVQAASWWWGYASVLESNPRVWNSWHAANAALAVAGVATATWAVVASRPRRWLALLLVLPVLVVGEAYLLRWEWAFFIWSTRGFAP
jgi:hypothetical protein